LIKRGDIDEVRQRVNIADVVADYVTLKSAGVGSMKGLCPFHDERSPSFHVRPQAGFYHCFGCGEGGDVFSFLQKIDHLSFQEAVERFEARLDRVTAPPPAKKAATKASPPMPKIPVPSKVSRKSKMPGLAKQAERKAIATKLRIETSGLKSRIRGHVSARGRRAQAARESRN
jgi:hypothetical protein